MTREEVERVKSKPHGPEVAALIAEVERCWGLLESLRALPGRIAREIGWLADL